MRYIYKLYANGLIPRAISCVSWPLGEAGYTAARIAKALAEAGNMGKTVDLTIAGAAIRSGAELWSLHDDHHEDIRRLLKNGTIRAPGTFRIRWLP